MTETEARLDEIRGAVPPRSHNARTIAALTSNPGCARRAIMDAAGVDKQRVAAHAGFPAPFGQSQFAITRGNAFEAQVKANGCAELLRLLRDQLGLTIPEVSYDDLEEVGGNTSRELRHQRTRRLLARTVASRAGAGTLFDHPMLQLAVAGRDVYLEPDLIAFQLFGQFRVVEIKSFAVIDGQADGTAVASAATQSAVYVLAMRELLAGLRLEPGQVSHDVVLICPENFSSAPVATVLDVRKQLTVLRRQLSRLARIDELTELLPPGLTFDLAPDKDGVPQRPATILATAISEVPARYAPECLASCELCYFCRDEAQGTTAALGRDVRDDLGAVEYVSTALALADGTQAADDHQAQAAIILQAAARLRRESLSGAA